MKSTFNRTFLAVGTLLAAQFFAGIAAAGPPTRTAPLSLPPLNLSSYPRFAYVANHTDDSVSIYTVNVATGQLRHSGYVATGTDPRSVTVDPWGKFAYVANQTSNNVSAYTLNATTGALTSVGPAVAAGSAPVSVTVDPAGKFA